MRAAALTALAACGPNLTPATSEAPPSGLPCLPNLDGKIEIGELPLPAEGIEARGSYWVSVGDTRIDPAGPRWDWSAVATSDQLVEVATDSLASAWFATSFPTGELVAPLDLGHTVVGVLARAPQAITLLGLASATPSPPEGKTLVVYDQPVPLYVFPITAGAHWTSAATISAGRGTIDGLPFVGTQRFEVEVGAAGELDLPEVTFTQAHRLDTRVSVEPSGGPSVSRRQVSFVFECFGEVARATSRDGEPARDFTVARAVRRLGLR